MKKKVNARMVATVIVSVFVVAFLAVILANLVGYKLSVVTALARPSGFYTGDSAQWTATYSGTWYCNGQTKYSPLKERVLLKEPNGNIVKLRDMVSLSSSYSYFWRNTSICGSTAHQTTIDYWKSGETKYVFSQTGKYTLYGYLYFGSEKMGYLDPFDFTVTGEAPKYADGASCNDNPQCLSGRCSGFKCVVAPACSQSGCVAATGCKCGGNVVLTGFCKNGQTYSTSNICNPTPTPAVTASCINNYVRCADGYYQVCTATVPSALHWQTQSTACPSVCASLDPAPATTFETTCKNLDQQTSGDSTPQDGAETTCAMKTDKPCESATWNGDALCSWDESTCGGIEGCLSDADCTDEKYPICSGDGTCIASGNGSEAECVKDADCEADEYCTGYEKCAAKVECVKDADCGDNEYCSDEGTCAANGTKQCGLGLKLNEETGNCDPDWMLAGAIAVIFAAAMVAIYLVTRRNK